MFVVRYGKLSQRGKDRLKELYTQADYLSGELALMRRMNPGKAITMKDLENRLRRNCPGTWAKIDFSMFAPTGGMRVVPNEEAFARWYADTEFHGIQTR